LQRQSRKVIVYLLYSPHSIFAGKSVCSFAQVIEITTEHVELYGAQNMADLVLSRASGLSDINWDDEQIIAEWAEQSICEGHLDEYGPGWHKNYLYEHWLFRRQTKQTICSVPDEMGKKHGSMRPVIQGKAALSKEESRAILFSEGVLLHAGLRKCKSWCDGVTLKF